MLVGVTAYDTAMAFALRATDVDFVLVGDSLGMVVYGDSSTHFVTLAEMIRHTQAVLRGLPSGLVVMDLPLEVCANPEVAVEAVAQAKAQTGVRAVKIEGRPEVCRAVVESGMEVMGHVGLKPQQVSRMTVQGRDPHSEAAIVDEALALQAAGCFAVVVECVPVELGRRLTQALTIPTIGIGAGPHCDGQILVTHDLIGFSGDFHSKFVRRYADVTEVIQRAVSSFVEEVRMGHFPTDDESYS